MKNLKKMSAGNVIDEGTQLKKYTFTLGQDLKRDCILLVGYIHRANQTKDKTVYLEQLLDISEVARLEFLGFHSLFCWLQGANWLFAKKKCSLNLIRRFMEYLK